MMYDVICDPLSVPGTRMSQMSFCLYFVHQCYVILLISHDATVYFFGSESILLSNKVS